MALSHTKQNVVRYVEETTPYTTPANPAMLLLSKETVGILHGLDKDMKEVADLGAWEVEDFYSARNMYAARVDFTLYDVDVLDVFMQRTAQGAPRSFTLEAIHDLDQATPRYLVGRGWRAQKVKLTGKLGEAWKASVTFVGGKWADPAAAGVTLGSGSRQAKGAISAALRTFAGGAITLSGATWALLLDEFDFEVDHGTEARGTTGDADPVQVTYKHRRISGKANFALEDGANAFWPTVKNLTEKTIELPFGGSGQPKLTFSGVRFPKLDVEAKLEQDALMGNVPWRAETYTKGTVA